MLLFFKIHKVYILLLIVFFLLLSNSYIEAVGDPGRVVELFIKEINKDRYSKAYLLFSKGLKQEVTLQQFKKSFNNVKSVSLLKKTVIEQRYNIARIKLKIASSEWAEGKLVKKQYNGSIVLIPEVKQWKLLQVYLEEIVTNGKKEKKIRSL